MRLSFYSVATVVLALLNFLSWTMYFQVAQDLERALSAHDLLRSAHSLPSDSENTAGRVIADEHALAGAPVKLFKPGRGVEVLLWESFDESLLFSAERQYQVSKMYGSHRTEILGAVAAARRHLPGTQPEQAKYKLVWGAMMADRTGAFRYVLDFRREGRDTRISLLRRIGPYELDETPTGLTVKSPTNTLHIVLTLKGRTHVFEKFVALVGGLQAAVKDVLRLCIVVSVYADQGESVAEAVSRAEKALRRRPGPELCATVVPADGEFTRGRGLQTAASAVKDPQAILFLCDVDMHFNSEFVRRCARNAVPGLRAYFPVPFSYYRSKPQRIGDDFGQWRRYGLGMACVARSDLEALGGFNTKIRGWGEEDVDLFERFVRTKLEIMRVIDAGLQHLWHGKSCPAGLSSVQRQHCLWSMMEYEGTKKDLAQQLVACRANTTK
eukprot:m.50401 g.50401  ORF g.50401 m.50401 type:complete len:440 (-) comp6222_c0_seq1:15-1334(-)